MENPTPQIDPGVEHAQTQAETTHLSPLEEALFQAWGHANGIEDIDAPDAKYDYRGFYKASNGKVHPPGAVEHFPDLFKQHGHPTFSVESKYSKGPFDGGMWSGEQFVPQMQPAVAHEPSETEKDPMRTLIDLMSELNKHHSETNKGKALDQPKKTVQP